MKFQGTTGSLFAVACATALLAGPLLAALGLS